MRKLLIGLISFLTLSAHAVADGHTGVYGGLKVGMMSGTSGIDSGYVNGFNVGYNFANQFAVEFEYSIGSLDFGKDFFDQEGQFAGSVLSGLDVDTKAIYGVYRSDGDFFFKSKLSISDVSVSSCCHRGEFSGKDEKDVSYGIGFGYQRAQWSIEGEITRVEKDLDSVGIDLNYRF